MKLNVEKKEVKSINSKLFAYDLIYSNEDDEESGEVFTTLLSRIIQEYNPEDALSNVPTIIEIKDENINNDTIEQIRLLSTTAVFVQFNSRVLSDSNNVNIIRALKQSDYKIVIEINENDKVFTIAGVIADIVKFDIKHPPEAIINSRIKLECKILAYNVDTPEDYTLAESANIPLYEGKYVGGSTELAVEGTKCSRLNFLAVMSELTNTELDIDKIIDMISRDPLMAAQVIRLANSVYFGSRERIESIDDAISRIGLANLKRWIFLMEFSHTDYADEEVIKISYHRALFCERIAEHSKGLGIKPGDAYLIGLFSTISILTGKTMDNEIQNLHLNEVVEESLIYRDGKGGRLINLVRAYECANWARIDKYLGRLKLNKNRVSKIYYESLEEVQKVWDSLTELGSVY